MSTTNERVKGRILIADDDEDLREIIVSLFERQGFLTVSCEDGESMIEAARSETPIDAIILDLLLPFADGFDLIQQVRSLPKHTNTPIIILSDLTSEEEILEAFKLRVNDVISKPFQPRELKARVLRWIGHPTLPAFEWNL